MIACRFTSTLLAALLFAASAHAQERPTASLLSTATAEGVRAGVGGAVDRMLRTKLEALDVVDVRGAVALDISEVQLALGCIGETPECLSQVAGQVEVQVLVLPNLDRAGDALVLSIARFDAQSGDLARVQRRAEGEDAETAILDTIDGALRELFGLPPPVEEPGVSGGSNGRTATPREPQLVGPIVVTSVGAAALIGGIVAGVLFQGEADAYADVEIENLQDVGIAEGHRQSAEDLAIAANVLFVTGGIVMGAGLVWLVVELATGGGSSGTALVPILGPEVAGLAVSGSFQ